MLCVILTLYFPGDGFLFVHEGTLDSECADESGNAVDFVDFVFEAFEEGGVFVVGLIVECDLH